MLDSNGFLFKLDLLTRNHTQQRLGEKESRCEHPRLFGSFIDPLSETHYLFHRLIARSQLLAIRCLVASKNCLLCPFVKKSRQETGTSLRLAGYTFWRMHVTPWHQFALLIISSPIRIFSYNTGIKKFVEISKIDLRYDENELLLAKKSPFPVQKNTRNEGEKDPLLPKANSRHSTVSSEGGDSHLLFQETGQFSIDSPEEPDIANDFVSSVGTEEDSSETYTEISSEEYIYMEEEVIDREALAARTQIENAKDYIENELRKIVDESLTPEEEETLETLLQILKEEESEALWGDQVVTFFSSVVEKININEFAELRKQLEKNGVSEENIQKIVSSPLWIEQKILDHEQVLTSSKRKKILDSLSMPEGMKSGTCPLPTVPKRSEASENKLQEIQKKILLNEINNPSRFKYDDIEKSLLTKLRVSVDKLSDRHFYYQNKLELMFEEFFQEGDFENKSLNKLRKWIKAYSFFHRLQDANESQTAGVIQDLKRIPEENFAFLWNLLCAARKTYSDERRLLQETEIKEYSEDLNKEEKFSNDYKEFFLNEKTRVLDSVLKEIIGSGFSEHLEKFSPYENITVSNGLYLQEFAKAFSFHKQDVPKRFSLDLSSAERSMYDWLITYGPITIPFMQGNDDPNEVLDKGVCLGLSTRIATNMVANPSIDSADLHSDEVLPIDRKRQAGYNLNVNKNPGIESVEGERVIYHHLDGFLKGFSQEECFKCDKIDVAEMIGENIQEIQDDGNGVLMVFVKNHALCIQLNVQEKKYRIYDPNVGLIEFENLENLTGALGSLITAFYPKTVEVKTSYLRKRT